MKIAILNGTPLQDWISQQIVGDEMLWKGSWGRQLEFIRDDIARLIGTGMSYHQFEDEQIARVISTHTSKSIVLPVVEITRTDLGIRFIMRNNFHDWKLTVLSQKPIEADFSSLFYTEPPPEPGYTGDHLSSVYFEGFPKDLVRGYWSENKCEWSAEVYSYHEFWTVIYLCMKAIGAMPIRKYMTEAEHKAKLEADRKENNRRQALRDVQES